MRRFKVLICKQELAQTGACLNITRARPQAFGVLDTAEVHVDCSRYEIQLKAPPF